MEWNKLVNESTIPVIHSIDEFLELCLNEALAPRKGVVDKQGKIVNARRCETEGEKVPWQDEPLMTTKGYALVKNDKEGKDISPVAPDVFNDKTLWTNKR